MDAALAAAFEATWPAARHARAGGFHIGEGRGAGGRVSSAWVDGDWTAGDIAAAEAIHAGWGQPSLFRVDDDATALAEALLARGYRRDTPTAILEAGLDGLTDRPVPQIMAFTIWPPLAIQREIWAAGEIDPARQAVMARVAGPRAALLGRIEDRAAGAGFVACHQRVAMIHALEILPEWRRRGLASWMVRCAAFWAAEAGADRLALAVGRANEGALALYRRLGFRETGGYAYFRRGRADARVRCAVPTGRGTAPPPASGADS